MPLTLIKEDGTGKLFHSVPPDRLRSLKATNPRVVSGVAEEHLI